ncbi:MAG TPA: alkaline phosphatase family protein [Pirellulales bacterium]|nr:alkaline phosphatase family protein [Pirellulales bacterium]
MSIFDSVRRFFHRATPVSADPIRHVVVLMFENHSFDQMLGCFKSVYPRLEGVDPKDPRTNSDSTGRAYPQQASDDTTVDPDPMHEVEHILNQLANGNSGFVSEYEKEYPTTTPDQRRKIMDYFGMGKLPALHELAGQFTICDHWYSSVPGPTWTNRFFVHSGTSLGRVRMPEGFQPSFYLGYDQATIYDRLNEKGIPWLIYHGDVPLSLLLSHQRKFKNSARYRWLADFFVDASGPEADFPAYVFIEPNYFHFPLEQQPQNDDHPPHSTTAAQALLAEVYNAIRRNDDLWNSTLLVVLYDENGGFYDHVSPPVAVPPDSHDEEYTFDRYGVRVPAVLISPWVDQRVLDTEFDHTSLLKYLIEKWSLAPLTNRVSKANSIGEAIMGSCRSNTPTSLPVAEMKPMMATAVADQAALPFSDHQRALLGFTKFLESETKPPADAMAPAFARELPSEAHRARDRVRVFLEHQRAAAGLVEEP